MCGALVPSPTASDGVRFQITLEVAAKLVERVQRLQRADTVVEQVC